jgi:polyferredoxin
VLYTVLWGGVGLGLIVALFMRTDIDMSISPIRNPTIVVLSDGAIRNAYDMRLRNMGGEPRPSSCRSRTTPRSGCRWRGCRACW